MTETPTTSKEHIGEHRPVLCPFCGSRNMTFRGEEEWGSWDEDYFMLARWRCDDCPHAILTGFDGLDAEYAARPQRPWREVQK